MWKVLKFQSWSLKFREIRTRQHQAHLEFEWKSWISTAWPRIKNRTELVRSFLYFREERRVTLISWTKHLLQFSERNLSSLMFQLLIFGTFDWVSERGEGREKKGGEELEGREMERKLSLCSVHNVLVTWFRKAFCTRVCGLKSIFSKIEIQREGNSLPDSSPPLGFHPQKFKCHNILDAINEKFHVLND